MPGPSLSLDVKKVGAASIVFLSGDIDASSIRDFQSTVEPLCGCERPQVILDCTALSYVNSTGLGALFTLSRMCRTNGGKLVMYGVRPKIRNVITVLGLETLLVLCDTREDAVAIFKNEAGTTS